MEAMRAAPSMLLPFVVLIAGCAPKAQHVGGVPRSEAAPRVVSLSPNVSEIIGSSFDVRLLVGRTAADDYPTSLSNVPIVAETKPDFEKIKGLAPTVVLYDADLFNEADVKKIKAMGAEAIGLKARTVEEFEKELYELSGKLGSETNVSAYVDRMERERNAAQGDRPSPEPKVAVVLGGGDYVAGTDSFVADVVKIAGGQPVGPASTKFEPMSPEAIVAAAPDIVILATSKKDKAAAAKDSQALFANPGFKATPALKNGRVAALDQDVVVRRGARVDTFIRDLHRAILRLLKK